MKKFISTLMITLAALLNPSLSTARPSVNNPGWFGDIGLEGYYYNYREKVNKQFFMKNTGPVYGLYYAVGYQLDNVPLNFALDGYFSRGSLRYNPRISAGNHNNSHSIGEARLLGTYLHCLENLWQIGGYTGFALRALLNDGADVAVNNGGVSGYLRISNYFYIPFGFKFINEIDDMQLIGHLEYDWLVRGKQISVLSVGRMNNNQYHGFGTRFGLDLLIPSSYGNFDYNVGAFIRYWSVENSAVSSVRNGATSGFVPKNRTYEVGLKLGLAF